MVTVKMEAKFYTKFICKILSYYSTTHYILVEVKSQRTLCDFSWFTLDTSSSLLKYKNIFLNVILKVFFIVLLHHIRSTYLVPDIVLCSVATVADKTDHSTCCYETYSQVCIHCEAAMKVE